MATYETALNDFLVNECMFSTPVLKTESLLGEKSLPELCRDPDMSFNHLIEIYELHTKIFPQC